MKTMRALIIPLLVGLFCHSSVKGEDIDLYSGIGAAAGIPNVLIILDTAANFSASVTGTCAYADGSGSPSIVGALAGLEQCALYNVIDSLETNADGSAKLNIGLMFYNETSLSGYGCPTGKGGCLVRPLTPMTTANKTALKNWIKTWVLNDIKSNSESTGATMQEAWAYYTGGTGVSGRTYAGIAPTSGCQKNFVIFIGNAYNTNGTPGDGGLGGISLQTLLSNAPGVTAAQRTAITVTYDRGKQCNTTTPYYTMPNHGDSSGLYADEWARYMYQADIYNGLSGQQNITTYTIAALGPSCKPDYPALLSSMANVGGGKYYSVNADAASEIKQAILKILNEVQDVNSVFASSSLPVSVNAQGTYLNQIFMGMFRPDANGYPRWLGNLKQYQFIPVTVDGKITLQLGDSAGDAALSSAGTGFISPSAVSFWTSKNVAAEPDLSGGFWKNKPQGDGQGFDSPDGQLVEKGGAAQVLRKTYSTVDYTATAGTSTNLRKLYTYCPSGTGCNSSLTNSANAFDSSNADITDAMLGTGTRNITQIASAATVSSGITATAGSTLSVTGTSDSGSVRTATASEADVAKIGAVAATGSIKVANGDTCTATVASASTFTYPKTCGSTGAQTISLLSSTLTVTKTSHGLSAGQKVTVSNCSVLTTANGVVGTIANITTNTFEVPLSSAIYGTDTNCRYTPNTATVTSVGHGFPTGETVTIASASPTGYNGSFAITVTGSDTFTYQYSVAAPLATYTGPGSGGATATGNTNKTTLVRWVRGQDNKGDESGPGGTINIRPSIHGDVLHSRPVVINYGSTIVVYYGSNDGVFRAVNGNQSGTDAGKELWGFIPSEFFGQLKRLYDNSPQLQLPSTPSGIIPTPRTKDYFVDGPTGLYQVLNSDGTTNSAIIYLSMRRGGRFMYALDVTTPSAPTVLWKKKNTDANFGELGQTWSQPKVGLIKGYTTNPVLVFGAGYDPAEDSEPPAADAMGRGIFVADAQTGDLVWRAIPKASGSTSCTGTPPAVVTCEVVGMNYSIPSDITMVDRDNDGKVDRLYAVDTGGNVWRVDLEPGGLTSPASWKIYKIAALGCGTGVCSSGATPRKFFYPADIVATSTYDAILVGSGDREHPLSSQQAFNTTNRLYMLKDVVGNDGSGRAVITESDLFDATTTAFGSTSVASGDVESLAKGYYVTLRGHLKADGTYGGGEKVVNAPTTVAGVTFFGTNAPIPADPNSCASGLGEAKGYRLNPFTGVRSYVVFDGGGLPPTPVSGVVNVTVNGQTKQMPFVIGGGGASAPGASSGTQDCVGADCHASTGGGMPPIEVSTSRTRTYWYYKID